MLDLSRNKITEIEKKFSHSSLTSIDIQENPITYLILDIQHNPELANIQAGSKELESIDKGILLKCFENKLRLEISPKFRNNLRTPPFSSLYENRDELKKFLDIDELDLSSKKIGKQRFDSVERSLQRFTAEITKIILDGQSCVSENNCRKFSTMLSEFSFERLEYLSLVSCDMNAFPDVKHLQELTYLDVSGNHFTSNVIRFDDVHCSLQSLKVCDCNLKCLFDLRYLPNIKELDISRNKLSSLDQLGMNMSLKILAIHDNPVEEIKINTDSFPEIKILKIGSPSTRYISFSLLQSVADSKCSCPSKVLDDYKTALGDKENVLDDDKNPLKRYLKDKEFNMSALSSISSAKDKLKAILWLFDQKEKDINALHCSGQKEFFRQTETDLNHFVDNPKLEHTETVFFGPLHVRSNSI